jgi:hypothetical protein
MIRLEQKGNRTLNEINLKSYIYVVHTILVITHITHCLIQQRLGLCHMQWLFKTIIKVFMYEIADSHGDEYEV